MIDRDEDGFPDPRSFFTDAIPCESCGQPCTKREWNQEHEIWVGLDCSCNLPDEPVCPGLRPVIEAAQTVAELMDSCRAHRRTCPLCGPRTIVERKPADVEADLAKRKVA